MKRVAILGFGIEGQDAARWFQDKADITIFDQKSKEELAQEEWQSTTFKWITGPDYLDRGLPGFDLVIRSPGFYRYHPVIIKAEKEGVEITSNTRIFFDECKKPIIGITGTKGKGTTARMLELGLANAGFGIAVAGNIGEPMLSLLPQANNSDFVILELSSFQLIDLHKSPYIAVVTNITTDHLNWHRDRKEYVEAKHSLWKHQTEKDFVVCNFDDQTSKELAKNAKGKTFWFSLGSKVENGAYLDGENVFLRLKKDSQIGTTDQLQVPGEHNVANALAALLGASLCGADAQTVWKGITSYQGSSHRLEKVAEINRVTYINDSAATTPEATIAALKTFTQPKILIAGGSAKGVKFTELARVIKNTKVKAVLLMGETSKEIETELAKAGYNGVIKTGFAGIEQLVKKAGFLAKTGYAVLLSPACASFGVFANYQERGAEFRKTVSRLK